jgi:hypothetical protein
VGGVHFIRYIEVAMKLSIVVLALLTCSCSVLQKNGELTDSEIKKLISGGWAEYVDKNNTIQVYSGYMENGTYHSYGYMPPEYEIYIYFDGNWEIENGSSCITVKYDSVGVFSPGERFCNKIIEITDKVFIFESYGKQIEMKKIHNAKL